MSDDNDLGEKIYTAVLSLGQGVGRLEEECRQHGERLASIDRRLEAGSSQMHGYGTTLAQQGERLDELQRGLDGQERAATERRRHCAEQFAAIGVQWRDTGKQMALQNGERRGVRLAAKVLLAVLGLIISAAGAFHLGQCRQGNHHGGKAPVTTPAKR